MAWVKLTGWLLCRIPHDGRREVVVEEERERNSCNSCAKKKRWNTRSLYLALQEMPRDLYLAHEEGAWASTYRLNSTSYPIAYADDIAV